MTLGHRDNRSENLKFTQDHPVPIETHGLLDGQVNQMIGENKGNRLQSDEDLFKYLKNITSILDILRKDNTKFDATRDNIEILWERQQRLTSKFQNYTGPETSPPFLNEPGAIVPVPPALVPITEHSLLSGLVNNDHPQYVRRLFFGCDTIGGTAISNVVRTDIPINGEVVKDSPYTHAANSAEVTVSNKRKYEIIFEAGFSLTDGVIIEVQLQKKPAGGSFADMDCGKAYCGA